jgi:hypothetical protein
MRLKKTFFVHFQIIILFDGLSIISAIQQKAEGFTNT